LYLRETLFWVSDDRLPVDDQIEARDEINEAITGISAE
jgi:hypothetical protein